MMKRNSCDRGTHSSGLAVFGFLAAIAIGTLPLHAQRPAELASLTEEENWKGHAVIAAAPEGHVRPHAWIRDAYVGPAAAAAALRSGPGGFWPVDMQTAYKINAISGLPAIGSTLSGGGAGL
jgi:hypothetical protein